MADAEWAIVQNPAWSGVTPRLVNASCHDGSAFLTVACTCGEQMHVHESQIAGLESVEISAYCKGCGDTLAFGYGTLSSGFAEMRSQGWIK